MSTPRSRFAALAVLTVAVAGSGLVALGTVCDFDPQCGEPVDRTYSLSQAEGDAFLSYILVLEEGEVAGETVTWTASPPEGDASEAGGQVFYLAIHKNDIPLDPGVRHVLGNASGVVTWDSRATDSEAKVGDTFTFTLYADAGAEDVTLHRSQVRITR